MKLLEWIQAPHISKVGGKMHNAGECLISVDNPRNMLMLTDEQRAELIEFLGKADMDCRLWEQILIARQLMSRFQRPNSLVSPKPEAITRAAEDAGLDPRYFSRDYTPVEETHRLVDAIAQAIRDALGFDVVDETILRLAGYFAQPYPIPAQS